MSTRVISVLRYIAGSGCASGQQGGTSDTVRIVVSDRSKDRNTGKSTGCSYPGNFPEQLCDLRSCSRTEYVWTEKYDDKRQF